MITNTSTTVRVAQATELNSRLQSSPPRTDSGTDGHALRQRANQQAQAAEQQPAVDDSSNRLDFVSAMVAEARSRFPGIQRDRIVDDCLAVGRAMKLSDGTMSTLNIAALLCDIGKLALPNSLVSQPHMSLDARARRAFYEHPNLAADSINEMDSLREVATALRAHCEHQDGSGYPNRLKGGEIPLVSRILCVVRTYRDLRDGTRYPFAFTQMEARDFLAIRAGRALDPIIVEHFCIWLNNYARGTGDHIERIVRLKDLRPGMRMSRDLRDENGLLMLAGGVKLTARLINRLKTLGHHRQSTAPLFVEDCCT
ncbi:MAG: HD domain-containing phosphohydrolase [Pseudomonadota bacterium]